MLPWSCPESSSLSLKYSSSRHSCANVVAGSVLSTLMRTHLIPMRTLSGRHYYYHHCATAETEAHTFFFFFLRNLPKDSQLSLPASRLSPGPKLHPIHCSLRVVLVFPSLKLKTTTDPSMKAKRLSEHTLCAKNSKRLEVSHCSLSITYCDSPCPLTFMSHNYLKQIELLCQTFGQVHVDLGTREEDLTGRQNSMPNLPRAHACSSDFRDSGPEAVWGKKK